MVNLVGFLRLFFERTLHHDTNRFEVFFRNAEFKFDEDKPTHRGDLTSYNGIFPGDICKISTEILQIMIPERFMPTHQLLDAEHLIVAFIELTGSFKGVKSKQIFCITAYGHDISLRNLVPYSNEKAIDKGRRIYLFHADLFEKIS